MKLERHPGHEGPGRLGKLGWAAGLGVCVLAFAWLAVAVCGGEDGEKDQPGGLAFVDPVELSSKARNDLRAAVDAVPAVTGFSDADKTHSLLGSPDVFELWFDPGDGGAVVRSETWYYLDLEVSYEFRDGSLLFTIPMDDVPGLVLPALQYDPLAFSATTSLDDVRKMLDDPDALTPLEIRAEYELEVKVWAGEQLVAAFDTNGELLYVETVAISLGNGQ